MREILFRGKRFDNGELIEGDLIHRKIWGKEIAVIRVSDDGFDNYDEYEVIPETVGQYTGLTDKNGKKIFEGDIVEHHVQGDILINRGVVNWDDENARFAYQLNTMNPCFYMFNNEAFEVIGNVFDDPELLEVGK